MTYLLDTNICIALLRGNRKLAEKIDSVGMLNCRISEITKAELLIGAELSQSRGKAEGLMNFLYAIESIPISNILQRYASEKVRLLRKGTPLEDFDLLIGCTAVEYNMIMVTNNTSHLARIEEIRCEDWIKSLE